MHIISKKLFFWKTNVFLLASVVFFAVAHSTFALTITPIKLELQADPGQTVKQEITLYNEKDTSEVLYISYANFEASGESGNPTFVDAKDDIGSWMKAAERVSIAAKSSQIVPLIITVPKDATPGGHFAAVFWGTVPTDKKASQVSIGAKTGLLVLLSVRGDVNEDGGILEFNTKNKQSFYTSLPVTFYYRFQNNGDDRVKPVGEIAIKNMLGLSAKRIAGNPVDGNVLPRSTRKIEAIWQGNDGVAPLSDKTGGNFFNKVGHEWRNFAFGHYVAHASLSYGLKNQVTTAKIGFWVFPWHLTVFALAILLVLYFGSRKFIQHYNAWVISKAEEMIRREMSKKKTKV